MNVDRYRFARTFRRRWSAYLGVALLIGLVGGVALASLAGARRTASAFPRLLDDSNSSDLFVDAGPYDRALDQRIRSFPQVESTSSYVAFDVATLQPDGSPDLDAASAQTEWIASLDGLYFDQDRFVVTSGRMADRGAVDQVVISESEAALAGYRVGQRLDVGVFDDEKVNGPDSGDGSGLRPEERLTVTITGIGLFTDEIVQDEVDRIPRVLLTPAFAARNARWATYAWTGLALRGGAADVPAVKDRYLSLLEPGAPHFFRVTSTVADQGQRAIRPQAVALAAFGAIALLVALLLGGQALGRQLRLERGQLDQLRAMGAGPVTTRAQGLTGAALVILVGAVAAVGVAVALSPLSPIGPVRRVEPDPGFTVDAVVLAVGALVLVVVLGLTAAVIAWRQAPHRMGSASKGELRTSTLTSGAISLRLSPAAVAGVRQAVRPGTDRSSVPTRSVMAGAAIAVLSVVASITFAGSLDHLVNQPHLFGWNWDRMLLISSGYGNVPDQALTRTLGRDREVQAWTGVYFGSLELDGLNVPAVGAEVGAEVAPPVLQGRAIASEREVVLGQATLDELGKRVGDTVTLAGAAGPVPLRIVGTATLPTIGVGHGSHPSMGSGALLSWHLIPGSGRSITGEADQGPNAVLVRFRPGADPAEARASLRRDTGRLAEAIPSDSIQVTGVQHPAEIVNYQDMGSGPAVLATGLMAGALLSLILALVASVRRRRRELALLKTLGFTRRQLTATVAWQSAVIAGIGVLIGVPAGVVAGRLLWIGFAQGIFVVVEPVVPLLPIALVAAGALVVAVLVATVPGLMAARTPTAEILRTD